MPAFGCSLWSDAMADQISPMGSLASGPVQTLLPANNVRSAQDNPQPAQASTPTFVPADTAQAAKGPVSTKPPEVDPKAITSYLQQTNSNLAFKIDKSTGIPFFQVVDATSGQVIRQVPSADVLAMAQKLQAMSSHKDASGILLDKEG